MEQTKSSIHVFVNRRKVEFYSAEVTGRQILDAAGFSGQGWDLLQLQGEGDPTGGTLIIADQTVMLKNGDHLRAIPGNRTFGS